MTSFMDDPQFKRRKFPNSQRVVMYIKLLTFLNSINLQKVADDKMGLVFQRKCALNKKNL